MNSKTTVILLLSCLFLSTAMAQKEQSAESEISGVTLFLDKAQVTRIVKQTLVPGRTDLVVTGLTPQLDPHSIQVAAKGNLMILGTSHRLNYLNELTKSKSLKSLLDSAALCQKYIHTETSTRNVLDREEQMILANQKISGTNQNLTVAELRAMADFYRSRLNEIANARTKADDQIRTWNQRLTRINSQIGEQNELARRNTSEIIISVNSEKGSNAQFEISYVVGNAGWTPEYDIRSAGTKDNLSLDYKANVRQATGEDWENVPLVLSTANPNLSGVKPQLQPWYINFAPELREMMEVRKRSIAPTAAARQMEVMMEAPDKIQEDAQSLAEVVSMVETTLNVEFRIALPTTVKSSSKPVQVDIRKATVQATYEYSVVPKLDKDAFLMARLTGWDALNLLPGEASIYFEGTFVGKTYIDPNNLRDTLSISLGRDKRIVVSREKIKDLSSRKLVGSSQREVSAWQISVRNSKAEAVRIIVEDQMPISRNNQLEVIQSDAGGAKQDSVTGKLEWSLQIPAGETRKLNFRYEVKYPKDKTIIGL